MTLWNYGEDVFSKSTDVIVDDFNSSIRFDQRLYREDIEGSIAHVTMLAAADILTNDERNMIISGLKDLEIAIEKNRSNLWY